MNWTIFEERIKNLPDNFQEQTVSFLDILYHGYKAETELEGKFSDINLHKLEIIKFLLLEKDIELLLSISNLISGFKTKLTQWETNQIEIGLNDLENGKRISHKAVMKKIDEVLK